MHAPRDGAPSEVFILTSKPPFPPDDGQKIPLAAYHERLSARGIPVHVEVLRPAPDRGLARRLGTFAQRLNPAAGFPATEALPPAAARRIAQAERPLVIVSPARLLPLVAPLKATRPDLRIVLQLNDAKWPMYREALSYGLGLTPGGAPVDLAKGLLTPVTWLRERHAYGAADVVIVQTERERARLPALGPRAVVAMNAVPAPDVRWHGTASRAIAMQVNFTNRRAGKWRPFVTRIWPALRAVHPDVKLDLFGPGEALPPWARGVPGLRHHGHVGDLDAFLAARRLLVMPLDHATGVSNTVLRGLALDMPQVISHGASEGLRALLAAHPATRIAHRPADYLPRLTEALTAPHSPRPGPIGDWDATLDHILERLPDRC